MLKLKSLIYIKDFKNCLPYNCIYNRSNIKGYFLTVTNKPYEWEKYENDPLEIINMEYRKLIDKNTKSEIITSLYRLSVACLNYWRFLK